MRTIICRCLTSIFFSSTRLKTSNISSKNLCFLNIDENRPSLPAYYNKETNIPDSQIPSDLPKKLCLVLSKSLGKPINYCVATVIGGVNMSWGGSDEPAAQATLMSVGNLGEKENIKHSKAIFDVVTKELNIAADRLYITFNNIKGSELGYSGTTLQAFFGGE